MKDMVNIILNFYNVKICLLGSNLKSEKHSAVGFLSLCLIFMLRTLTLIKNEHAIHTHAHLHRVVINVVHDEICA